MADRRAAAEARFGFGDTVYRKLALVRRPGMVVGIMLRPNSTIYLVSWHDADEEHEHYAIELEAEPTGREPDAD